MEIPRVPALAQLSVLQFPSTAQCPWFNVFCPHGPLYYSNQENYSPRGSLDVQCIFYVLNVAVKHCMSLTHRKLYRIWKLLSCHRCSFKRHDLFNDVLVDICVRCKLPPCNEKTRCSSTFEMIRKCFCARLVLSTVVRREENLAQHMVSEAKLKVAENVLSFLKAAASAIEHQSVSLYLTLRLTLNIFDKLENACRNQISDGDEVSIPIASSIMQKLQQNSALVKKPVSNLYHLLYPRFTSNILSAADVLKAYVSLQASWNDTKVAQPL